MTAVFVELNIIVSQTPAGNAAFLLRIFWYAGTFIINEYLNAWKVTFFYRLNCFSFFSYVTFDTVISLAMKLQE